MASTTESSSAIKEAARPEDATAEELAAPPETINMTDDEEMGAASDKDQSDSSKLKTLLGILKRMVGVKDIAAIRLSLPANLLEPVPNLEYWNYLDRGDLFTSVADLDDPLDRMLAVLRFTFTKELKYVKGKVCKPYNSILGEHFRSHWDVEPLSVNADGHLVPVTGLAVDTPEPLPLIGSSGQALLAKADKKKTPVNSPRITPADEKSPRLGPSRGNSDAGSTKKGLSRLLGRKKGGGNDASNGSAEPSANQAGTGTTSTEEAFDALSLSGSTKGPRSGTGTISESKRRIVFITEQVSHHPPISSFYCECREAGVRLCGVDQLSAKFTGTNVKVFSGDQNKGIFLSLTDKARCGAEGEEYQITHPTASINGLLRGSLWVAICDTLSVTCRGGKRDQDDGTRLRAIVDYKDESWITKAKYALEGCIYQYGADEDAEEYTSCKQVPPEKVLVTFEGTWKGKIMYKRKGDKESRLLVNLDEIEALRMSVRPLSTQEPMESRKIWEPVTNAIMAKEFSKATKAKQEIEQRQRDAAAERKRKGET